MSETMQKGFKGAMVEAMAAFEGLAIAIGDSGVLEFFTDVVDGVTNFTRELSKTNPEILKWGAVLAGLAAAIGPVIFAVGTLGGAMAAAGGLGAVFATGLGVLTSTVLPALAIAIAGIGLVKLIEDLADTDRAVLAAIPGLGFLGEEANKAGKEVTGLGEAMEPGIIERFNQALIRMTGLTDNLGHSYGLSKKEIEGLEKEAEKYGITIDKTGKSQTVYTNLLKSAIEEAKEFKEKTADSIKKLDEQEKATDDAGQAMEGYRKAVKGAKEEAERFSQEQDIVNELGNLEWAAEQARDRLDKGLVPALATLSDQAAPKVATELPRVTEAISAVTNRVTGGKAPLDEYTEAMRQLGIKSGTEVETELGKMAAAVDVVRQQVEAGERPQRDLNAAIEAYNGAAGNAADSTGLFGGALQQISTIVTDFGKTVSDAIFGIFDRGKFNAGLDEQAADLRQSLADREQAFRDFTGNAETSMQDLRASHAGDVSQMEQDFNDSVMDREQSFTDFVAMAEQAFGDFTENLKVKQQEAIDRLVEGLERSRGALAEFERDQERRIADNQRDLGQSIGDRQKKFKDDLRKRKRDLEQFENDTSYKLNRKKVQLEARAADRIRDIRRRGGKDAEFQIGKVQATLARNLREAEADTARSIEVRRREFQDWVDDTETELKRRTTIEKRENAEQEADLGVCPTENSRRGWGR